MKEPCRGFALPLLLAIIALLALGGGTYFYMQNKQVIQPMITTSTTSSTSTNTNTSGDTTTCIRGRTQVPSVDLPPVITSLSSSSGKIGSTLEIRGCNLSGFEGDLDVTFEKSDGTQKTTLVDTFNSYATTEDTLIKVIVKEPCVQGETVYGSYSGLPAVCKATPLTPGTYNVYTTPWGKKSNAVSFTVTN